MSVDPVSEHHNCKSDKEVVRGEKVSYLMDNDPDIEVARLFDKQAAYANGDSDDRNASDSATVHSVLIFRPGKKISIVLSYPITSREHFD